MAEFKTLEDARNKLCVNPPSKQAESEGGEEKKGSIRCKECGFRVRGVNHTEGGHHRGREPFATGSRG